MEAGHFEQFLQKCHVSNPFTLRYVIRRPHSLSAFIMRMSAAKRCRDLSDRYGQGFSYKYWRMRPDVFGHLAARDTAPFSGYLGHVRGRERAACVIVARTGATLSTICLCHFRRVSATMPGGRGEYEAHFPESGNAARSYRSRDIKTSAAMPRVAMPSGLCG